MPIFGARNRDRTGTGIASHGILSPGRLPVPPLEHIGNAVINISKRFHTLLKALNYITTFLHCSQHIFYSRTAILQIYFVVLPKPPFLISQTSSSYVIPYSTNIPCAKPSPHFTASVLPSFESFVIFMNM